MHLPQRPRILDRAPSEGRDLTRRGIRLRHVSEFRHPLRPPLRPQGTRNRERHHAQRKAIEWQESHTVVAPSNTPSRSSRGYRFIIAISVVLPTGVIL